MRILGDAGQCTCRAMYGHYCYVELRRGNIYRAMKCYVRLCRAIQGYEVLCSVELATVTLHIK